MTSGTNQYHDWSKVHGRCEHALLLLALVRNFLVYLRFNHNKGAIWQVMSFGFWLDTFETDRVWTLAELTAEYEKPTRQFVGI
jgi:hypothetical protein